MHEAGKYELAIEKYKLALKQEPENPIALYELAYSYMTIHQDKDCIKTATQGIKLASKQKKGFFVTLGSCQFQLGLLDDAIATFKLGLKSYPNDAYLHLNGGQIIFINGQEIKYRNTKHSD